LSDIYYFAAYTDSGWLFGCDHQHRTIASAVACISWAGGFVLAAEDGEFRELTGAEEKEFQALMYGDVHSKKSEAPKWELIILILIHFKPK
jgi:hypothetical protein